VRGPDGYLCRRVPRVPVFLTLWSLLTLAYSASGSARRQVTINNVFMTANEQLEAFKVDLETLLVASHNLSDVEETFRQKTDQVPNSCAIPQVTQGLFAQLVNRVDEVTEESFELTGRLNDVFKSLPAEINRIIAANLAMTFLLGYVPMLPMVIEIVGTMAIMVFTCLSYYSHRPEISETAHRNFKKYGSLGFPLVIFTCMLLAAIYLQVGIVSAEFCLDVDRNVVGIVKHMDFSIVGATEKDLKQITEDVHGTAEYYVAGLVPNPAQKIVQQLETNIQTFDTVRNATKFITHVAGFVCPALKKVPIDETIKTLRHDIGTMRELLRAQHIWHYYHEIIRKTGCSALPLHAWELVWFNAIMGLVLLPILAVTAEVDLKRMVNYKTQQSFESLEEESDDDEDDSYLQTSAPTYTHKSGTVYPDRPDGDHDAKGANKKTFLA